MQILCCSCCPMLLRRSENSFGNVSGKESMQQERRGASLDESLSRAQQNLSNSIFNGVLVKSLPAVPRSSSMLVTTRFSNGQIRRRLCKKVYDFDHMVLQSNVEYYIMVIYQNRWNMGHRISWHINYTIIAGILL